MNVVGLLKATERAVAQFLAVADTVVPGSKQAKGHAGNYNRAAPD